MVNQDKANSIVNMVRNLIELRKITETLTNDTCNFDREQNFTKILHEKTTADRLI